MMFHSYYKMPAAQTSLENCVAHNGSLIPIPGRDVMVQAWYQGGISVFDWTDAAHPKEIAFFDRGPVDADAAGDRRLLVGVLVQRRSSSAPRSRADSTSSSCCRAALISQNEIDAAKTVQLDYLNAQDQPKFVWPRELRAGARVPRSARARRTGLRRGDDRHGADRARERREARRAAPRQQALKKLATQLNAAAAGASDQAKVRVLSSAVTELAGVRP